MILLKKQLFPAISGSSKNGDKNGYTNPVISVFHFKAQEIVQTV